jgi:predicted alpha/beta superfamily hydrolase
MSDKILSKIGTLLIVSLIILASGCIGGGNGEDLTSSSSSLSTSSVQSTTPTSSSTTLTSSSTVASSRSTSTASSTTSSQTGPKEVTVTFIVSVPDYTPKNSSIYIVGDFNGWNPRDERYRLKPLPDGTWAINLTFPYGKVIQFKFTRGSWETVEKGPSGGEMPNRIFAFRNGGVKHFTVYNWRDFVEGTSEGTHTITGNVKTFNIFVPQLNTTRRIWVYLPPDYNNGTKRYPVLYMFDGQNLFDEATSFAGEWGVDEALEKLYRERNFSLIVVGIDNGGDKRLDEYAPWVNEEYGRGGLGNATLEFIVQILKPLIDRQYRTIPNETGIMGSSLGGLMALYAGFWNSSVFRYVGAMSSAFWFNPQIYDFVKNAPSGPAKIYIDWGMDEGDNPTAFAESNEKMVQILKEKGYVEGKNLKVVVDKGGEHNEYYWGKRFPEAVLWLFGG